METYKLNIRISPRTYYVPQLSNIQSSVSSLYSSCRGPSCGGGGCRRRLPLWKITGGLIILIEQPPDSSGIPSMAGHVRQPIQSLYDLHHEGEIKGSQLKRIIISWGLEQSKQDWRLYFYKGTAFINFILFSYDM